jgi:hypothetical protein
VSAKFRCRILEERDLALLVRQEIPNREPVEVWIPRSQCDHISKRPDDKEGIPATITAADWILEKKGLIENA